LKKFYTKPEVLPYTEVPCKTVPAAETNPEAATEVSDSSIGRWIESHNRFEENMQNRDNSDPSEAQEPPAATPESKKPNKEVWRKKALKSWLGFLLKVAVVVAIGWVIFTYVFNVAVVDGTSMSPNLADGDLTLIYCLQDKYSVGEVVAYKQNDKIYFGRIVAVSGDVVDMSDTGSLFVNNVEQYEPNIFEATYKEGAKTSFPASVKPGTYFILGDKRESAHDSREFGLISEDDILGNIFALLRRRGF